MYIPNAYREDNLETLVAFMRAHSFATLLSVIEGAPFATHLPLVIRLEADSQGAGSQVLLTGHLAKANPQWRSLEQGEALVIFGGPHAYISPALYEKRESVPTWNYIAVHAYGQVRLRPTDQAAAEVRRMLEEMIETFDANYLAQWGELSDKFRDGLMQGIVAFEMRVTRLEGKYKLSQNRSLVDQHTVAHALLQSTDPLAAEIGAAMQNNLAGTV
jgi:transcriptional regulator